MVGVDWKCDLKMLTKEGLRKKTEVIYISKIGGILFRLTFPSLCYTRRTTIDT